MASVISAEKSLLTTPHRTLKGYVLVIHGGAGTMSREGSTPEQQAAYKSALADSLRAVRIIINIIGFCYTLRDSTRVMEYSLQEVMHLMLW